jgi:hypothetical protein
LVFDLSIQPLSSQPSSFGGLLQTDGLNDSDGDLFLRANDDGTYGIGISSQYHGAIVPETWSRVVFTIHPIDDVSARLGKFIDGALVGEQTVELSRYRIDPQAGLLLLTDNDDETFFGQIGAFALVSRALEDQEVAALGGAIPGGVFPKDSPDVIEFAFFADSMEDGEIRSLVGDAVIFDRGFNPVPVVRQITHKLLAIGDTHRLDLTTVFSGVGLTYLFVTESKGNAVSGSIKGSILTLVANTLGYSDFRVTATDKFGGVGSDFFRIRVAGPNAYSFVVLPDTQNYADSYPETFIKLTRWLADNSVDQKIEMILHVGDITNNNNAAQWAVTSEAYLAIDAANVPYTFLPGNHDQANGGSAENYSTNIDSVFSLERYFAAAPGGVYPGHPTSIANNYKLITTSDGTDWIVMSMEFGARDDVLRWANEILTKYAERPAIVLTHHHVNMGGKSFIFTFPDERCLANSLIVNLICRYKCSARRTVLWRKSAKGQLWNPQ